MVPSTPARNAKDDHLDRRRQHDDIANPATHIPGSGHAEDAAGHAAAEMLLARINDKPIPDIHHNAGFELIKRESTNRLTR